MKKKPFGPIDRSIYAAVGKLLAPFAQADETYDVTLTRFIEGTTRLEAKLTRCEEALTERSSELHAAKAERDEARTQVFNLAKDLMWQKRRANALGEEVRKPVPLLLWCPGCGARHIDPEPAAFGQGPTGASAAGESTFMGTPHRAHACQTCGMLWAPAVVPTVGVQFLPGCKNP